MKQGAELIGGTGKKRRGNGEKSKLQNQGTQESFRQISFRSGRHNAFCVKNTYSARCCTKNVLKDSSKTVSLLVLWVLLPKKNRFIVSSAT